jgi:hypothetical protein
MIFRKLDFRFRTKHWLFGAGCFDLRVNTAVTFNLSFAALAMPASREHRHHAGWW